MNLDDKYRLLRDKLAEILKEIDPEERKRKEEEFNNLVIHNPT